MRRIRFLVAISIMGLLTYMALDPHMVISDEKKDVVGKDIEKVVLKIDGMTCADCIRDVERAIMKVSGVIDARVTLKGFFRKEGQAVVKYEKGKVTPEQLMAAVSSASNAMYTYKAHLVETN